MNEDIYLLIIDLLSDNLSSDGKQRLRVWLEESEQNKIEYKKICEVWYATRWARYIAHISKNGAWNIIKLKREKEIYRKRLYYTISVAASIVILFGIMTTTWLIPETTSFSVEQKLVQNTPYSLQHINPTLILSTGESIDLVKKEKGRQLAEGSIAVIADSTSLFYKIENKLRVKKDGYNEVLVPACKNLKVELIDGTVVYMNSVSRLRYPLEFKEGAREVYLDGEAYFDVVEDKNKPFIVYTDKTSVKVLGTRFNVMSYFNEDETQITLVDGAVDVEVAGKHTMIKPGEQIIVDNELLSTEVNDVDVNKFIAWKSGLYKFESEPLERILKYLERQYNISYFFENKDAKSLRFTGAFSNKSSVVEIFKMLEQMVDIRFETQEGKKILIK